MDQNLGRAKRRQDNKNLSTEKKPRRFSDRIKQQEHKGVPSSPCSSRIINAGSTEIPPEERAFAIDLILSKILLCMSLSELKTTRLVCSRWSFLAAKIFAKRKPLRLCSSYKEIDGSTCSKDFVFGIVQNHSKIERRLEDLISVMRTFVNFPCTHFCFQDGSLTYSILQQFLSTHGSRIKRLCLNVRSTHYTDSKEERSGPPTLDTFATLLTKQAPNIERLRLDDLPLSWKNPKNKNFLRKSKSTEQVILPNLKILELPQDTPQQLLSELVRAAVNLKQLDIINGEVDFFIASKQFHLLKNLVFAPTADNLNAYEQIVNENVQLEKIEFFVSYKGVEIREELWSRTAEILHRLLASSCKTLRKIKWKPIGFLPDIQIPVLPNVTKMKIEEDIFPPIFHSRMKRIFPRGLSLSKVFPNLTTVIIDITPREEQATSDYFDSNYDPIPTVKNISIDGAHKFPPTFMKVLFPQIFPNAISGKFEHLEESSEGMQGIWKFRELKHLELTFDVGFRCDDYGSLFTIDPFFTGVSPSNCSKLKKTKTRKAVNQAMRQNPSITDLKHLTELKMQFYDQHEFVRLENEFYCLELSDIIGQYGLELCPGLKVCVSVDAEVLENVSTLTNYLAPIHPYVFCGPW